MTLTPHPAQEDRMLDPDTIAGVLLVAGSALALLGGIVHVATGR